MQNDLESFRHFLNAQLEAGAADISPEEVVQRWRDRRAEQLARLEEKLKPALEQSRRGESKPLDVEALKDRVTERLAKEGVTD
jgi:hypothetical protein